MQKVEQSNLGHGIKSAIIGAAIGYGAKYALPLTSQETDADYRRIIDLIKRNSVRSKVEFLDEIKNLRRNFYSLNPPMIYTALK